MISLALRAPTWTNTQGDSLLGRSGPLRTLVLAALVSGLGDRLNQVALAALILALTDSVASAGMAFVVATLPYVVLGLPAGALVDRFDRRTVLVGANVAQAVMVAAIPPAAALGLPYVYGLLFAATCARMLCGPAQQASIPDLVEARDLPAANALVRGAQFLTDALGYPVAAGLVVWLVGAYGAMDGTRLAFGLDALSFLLSAALLARLPLAPRVHGGARPDEDGWARRLTAGARLLVADRTLLTNTALFVSGPLLLGSLHTLWVGFAWRVTGTGALGYGLTEAANGAGMLVGVWLAQRLVRVTNKGRVILAGVALMGVGMLGTGASGTLVVAVALSVAVGIGNMLLVVPSVTLVQQRTPAALRGRVFSVRNMATYAALTLSNWVASGVSDEMGVPAIMVGLGVALLGIAGGGWLVRSAREAE